MHTADCPKPPTQKPPNSLVVVNKGARLLWPGTHQPRPPPLLPPEPVVLGALDGLLPGRKGGNGTKVNVSVWPPARR